MMKKITIFSFILVLFYLSLNAQNQMQFNQLSMIDAYSQIPLGQNIPFGFEAQIVNNGSINQTNVKLHIKELTTQTDYVSATISSLISGRLDTLLINSILLPNIVGNYKLIAWLSSDLLTQVLYSDTFKITINNNSIISRDNNTYTGERWAGTTNGLCDPYTASNVFQVKHAAYALNVNFVVSSSTKANSRVKAVLYKYAASIDTSIIVAQSIPYYIQSIYIPTTTGVNPPSITLAFNAPYLMQADTVYLVGIQVTGGADTVKIATDNTATPQDPQNCPYFDPAMNTWYIWAYGPAPAMMIRLNASTSLSVEDKYKTSLTIFPVPASSILNLDFGDWKLNNASLIIYSVSCIEVLKQELKSINKNSYEIDISKLPKGMYFLKVNDNKQSIVKKFIKE
ncbi:MAG: T9SS type A sorting domain-containing protein [Bacteroidetes bacterium]|nr:T9SS type A sorting domain-containing protein [Bacteroidota bacterium]